MWQWRNRFRKSMIDWSGDPGLYRARRAFRLSATGQAIFVVLLLLGLLGVGHQAEAQVTFTQITNSTGADNDSPSINSDGTRIAFRSDRNLTGGNADGNPEIFLWTSGSGITQITNTTGGNNYLPSINADGTRIAFASSSNLTGGNADGNYEIFLWTSGSGITQITNTTVGFNGFPSINADGTRIAFRSSSDLTPGSPGNADGNEEIFLWTSGSGITQITNSTAGDSIRDSSINADGTRIAFVSWSDLTPGSPGNADGNQEIFLWTSGSGISQITNSTAGHNWASSINSDGTRIAFYSSSDLTGGNADGNREIFLWTSGSGITQLTNTTGGGNFSPSINADGTRIAFPSSSNLTPGSLGNADGNDEIFLATPATGPRVDLTASGSGPGPTLINPVTVRYSLQGCGGKEMFLVVNAPAMGMPWSYLGISGWLPLPANLATITPYSSSGPPDGTYTLFDGIAPAGTYELYLGCDFVADGHLNIDTSSGLNLNGVYDYLSATVQ